MRRGRIFIYVGLILILGLVAVAALISRANQPANTGTTNTPQETAQQQTTNVVITTQHVSRGDEVGEGVVQLVAIPQDLVIEGMFMNVEDVLGMVARFDLEPGIFLTQSMVTNFENLGPSGSDAALLIDPGMVAVSIPVSRLSSVSYGLQRGDYVSVIATLLFVDLDPQFQSVLPNNSSAVLAPGPSVVLSATSNGSDGTSAGASLATDELLQTLTAQIISGGVVSPIGRLELDPTLGQPFFVVPSESQRPRSVSQTLIPKAMVLHVGTFPLESQSAVAQPTATPEGGDQAAQDQQPADAQQATQPAAIEFPDVITLVVSPQDAVTLNYLMLNGGYLSLAMRPANDDTIAQTESVTLQFLLDQYNIPIPAKLPYGLEPRINQLNAPVLPNDVTPVPQQ
jgi:pilus assembly protein CpaB